MEWVTGVKLTGLPSAEIQRLVAAGQEAFLTQLLEVGFFHGDPHPGNLLKVGALHRPHPHPHALPSPVCRVENPGSQLGPSQITDNLLGCSNLMEYM